MISSWSIAAATAATDAFAAGCHFAGEENMVRDFVADGIAVAAHGVIRQRFALPRLHGFAAGLRTDNRAQSRINFFVSGRINLFFQQRFDFLHVLFAGFRSVKSAVDKPHRASFVEQK